MKKSHLTNCGLKGTKKKGWFKTIRGEHLIWFLWYIFLIAVSNP
jgi:hypothetical protein